MDGKSLLGLNEVSAVQSKLNSLGIVNSLHRKLLCDALGSVHKTLESCLHPYVENWDGVYHCCDCKVALHEPNRVAYESEQENKVKNEDLQAFGSDPIECIQNAAISSHLRGVQIGWLVQWTKERDCWDIPTWKVRRKFILPETEDYRCRYVELPHLKGTETVGPAATFVSHCWGANWVSC